MGARFLLRVRDNRIPPRWTERWAELPVLVAITPRAGELNHRFILPSGLGITDGVAEYFISQANSAMEGRDYLAVRSWAAQQSGRAGYELLVLTGIDVKAMSERQRRKIEEKLVNRLRELSEWVPPGGWNAYAGGMAVESHTSQSLGAGIC